MTKREFLERFLLAARVSKPIVSYPDTVAAACNAWAAIESVVPYEEPKRPLDPTLGGLFK